MSCSWSYFTELHGHYPARHLVKTQQIGADGNGLNGECYERGKDLTTIYPKHDKDTREETSEQDSARKFPENNGDSDGRKGTSNSIKPRAKKLRHSVRPLPNFP